MWKRIRTALVLLLTLAIPTQGFAAATMLYCGPNHQRTVGSEASPAGSADTVAFQHADPHAQSAHSGHDMHEHAASVAQNDEPLPLDEPLILSVLDQVSAAGALEQSSKVTCSVCALCCSAAAVVSSPLVIPWLDISSAPIVMVPESAVSFLTGGPQRPPRPFLA